MIQIKQEQGLSMVEMLGTLAIIGVLSVGGVAGYTYAMNKYYTNEILLGASERMVLLMAKNITGEDLSLKEFENLNKTSVGTFSDEAIDVEGSIGIKITGVKKAVCENLVKVASGTEFDITKEEKNNTLIDIIEEDCEDTNNLVLVFNHALDPRNTGICTNGNVYLSYMDDPCATETPMTGDCIKNSDCAGNEFCDLTGSSTEKPDSGVCTTLYEGTPIDDFLIGPKMTWWSAENWCEAHDMNLVNISAFGISGYENDGCIGNECIGADWESLKQLLGNKYFWTTNHYDSRWAYVMFVITSRIQTANHNYSSQIYALCH